MQGKVYINYENDLTSQEQVIITHLCHAKTSTTMIAHTLESIIEGRAFTSQLLHRMRTKHMVERYGHDMHDLPGLFDKCRQVKSEGGLFEIIPSPTDFGIK